MKSNLIIGAIVALLLALVIWSGFDHYQGGDVKRECDRATRANVPCVYVPRDPYRSK